MSQTLTERNRLVDFGADDEAPEPPGVGMAISLGPDDSGGRFRAGQPVVLHGAYRADMDLIRRCREDLAASILLTLIRTDRPWGVTARLVTPRVYVEQPPMPPDAGNRENYRRSGQFKVDLVSFFELPAEAGSYVVEAVVGAYFSPRLTFQIV